MINSLSIFFLMSSLGTFTLGLWVVSSNKRNDIYRSWCLFCTTVALWSLGLGILTSVRSIKIANFFYFIHYFGAILIPISFLYFIQIYFQNRTKLGRMLSAGIVLAFFQLLLFAGGKLVAPLTPKWKFSFYTNPGDFYWLFMVYFFVYVVYAFYIMLSNLKSIKGSERKKRIFLLTATGIGYMAGSSAFLLVYFDNLPPYGIYIFLLFPIITTYGIVKHRLMDIEVIIKKTLVLAGLSSFVIAFFSVPLLFLPKVFAGSMTAAIQLWALVLSGMIVAALVGPINQFLVHITDRFLFQKKHEIKVVLKNLSEKVLTIIDLKQIGRTILSTLVETFRLESASIVIYDRKSERYRLLENSGLSPNEFAHSVRQYFSPLGAYEYFNNHRSITSLDQANSSELPAPILEWFKTAKARVCIPLFIDDHQSGFLLLGKKKSDQDFTQEEMDYFPTIESQVSLAIRNARLIETVVEEREAKVKAEHLAQRVKFARLIKHEIKNKLTHISGPANEILTYYIPRLKQLFKEQDEDWFLEISDKVSESSKKISEGVHKILLIAETSLGGVDKDDKTFLEMSCKIIWDDAKEESGVLGLCDFESNMPDGFAVYVNYYALQRVFVNLITNAYDAMKETNEKLIKLRCSYEQIEGKPVAYFEFQDFGCGIQNDIKKRIFEDGFSTKPKPHDADLNSSGYGQGLAACVMYIEKIHHGKIWVESEVGKGTTFKFWIPMKEENHGRH